MKTVINYKYVSYSLHVLIWSGLLLLPFVVSNAASGYKVGTIPGLFFIITVLVNMVIFYLNSYYLYPRLFNRRSWHFYLAGSLVLIIGPGTLKFFIIATWFPVMLNEAAVYRFVYAPLIVIFIISLMYSRIMDHLRVEQERKEKQSLQLSTELKFLRSQINPHFLFNVLTNIISLARKKSDKLEQSLIMLSDLMRYMLYDTQGRQVELRKEIEYLNSYVALQKLRFSSDVEIKCVFKFDENDHYTIEPMLLIPFVENAFKHVAVRSEQPYIHIKLLVEQGSLIFEVLNNADKGDDINKGENPGLGLNNVKTRLNLLYYNNYNLEINDDNNMFHIALTLKLT